FLSGPDANLLRANEIEIKSYFMMQRWGKDISPKIYRTLYRTELNDLIQQQIAICKLTMDCRSGPALARRRRDFAGAPLTIGAEEEYQIVSNSDWGLADNVDQVLSLANSKQFGREVYKSQIEGITPVCSDIQDVRRRLTELRHQLKVILPPYLS